MQEEYFLNNRLGAKIPNFNSRKKKHSDHFKMLMVPCTNSKALDSYLTQYFEET